MRTNSTDFSIKKFTYVIPKELLLTQISVTKLLCDIFPGTAICIANFTLWGNVLLKKLQSRAKDHNKRKKPFSPLIKNSEII